jgi:diacylglycerol kinase (ATP)
VAERDGDAVNRRWLAIVNPAAGGGNAQRAMAALQRALANRQITCAIVQTQGPGHATALARSAGDGFEGILAVGGDGTVHEVVNGLPLRGGPRLAVAPWGTGNDWARGLRLPRDPERIAALIERASTDTVPVGRATYSTPSGFDSCRFINGAGLGLDTAVLECLPTRGPRALAYAIGTLRALRHFEAVDADLTVGDLRQQQPSLLIYAGLGPYAGGGMQITPHARSRCGRLHVTVVPNLPLWHTLSLLPALYGGTIDRHPRVRAFSTDRLGIDVAATIRLEADGQCLGYGPVTLSASEDRLTVVTPDGR